MFRPRPPARVGRRSSLSPARRIRRRLAPVLLCLATIAALTLRAEPAAAQTNLSDLFRTLFVDQVVIAKTPAGGGVVAHTPVFVDDPRVTSVTNLIQQVSQGIGAQTASFPLGSSAGGFTYSFKPEVGVFDRSTTSFGPSFTDRAVTIGKRKWNFGANYVHASYDTLDGRNLQNGDIKFFLLHQPLTPPSYVEGDVIQAALSLDLKTDIFAMFADYGLTNALDIGVAIPIERVAANVTYHAAILDFATHAVSPNTHLFANGTKSEDFSGQGSATGLGDIIVRAKYNFLKRGGSGIAAAVDLHLPTGDSANFLGAGTTQAKLFIIMSHTAGRFSPHLNVGYTLAGTGDTFPVPDQINYSGGVEYAVNTRLTIIGDLIGRTDRNAFRLVDAPQVHTFQQGSTAPFETTTLPAIGSQVSNLSTGLAAIGAKLNPWQTLLISAHVLVPVNDAGLRARITPVVGFEYTF